ncbi:DUF1430 domain-containing protein [Paenibacillus sp. EC2-1]|uniref:DUF1430 domain-containing protein n=1 Tax=Paenibacillus sp. EC2-1 TaxID=3388665 RepID=UPI003BEF1952
MLIVAESQIFRLDQFHTPYRYTSLYLQHGQNEKDMIKDILQAADRNKVKVFTFIKTPTDKYTSIKLYGTPNFQQHINQELNIYDKHYKSLFLGDIHFSLYSLEAIQNLKDIHDFYIIGGKEQSDQFKTELINIYAGNFPQEGYQNEDAQYTVFAIWILLIGITLLFTYYDAIHQKKENLIRVSMGEKLSSIIIRNIASDTIVYTLMFLFIFILLNRITSISYQFTESLLCIAILLVLNAMVYVSLRTSHIKQVFSNTNSSSRKLLALNYGLKAITVIVTISVISSNLVLVHDSYQLYRQKPFFEKNAQFSYIYTQYRPYMDQNGNANAMFEESELLQSKFYSQHFSKTKATLISVVHSPLSTTRSAVMTNQNARDYLANRIQEFNSEPMDHDVYFLLPQSLSDNNQIVEELKQEFTFFENTDLQERQYKVIYYQNHVDITAINENKNYGSEWLENPIIIYNNISPESQPLNIGPHRANYIREIMYDITDEEFNRFLQKHDLTEANAVISKTNVMDKFNDSWNAAKKILYINLVFSILVLILEFMIITSIIKLEYEVNAIELSIRKVLGYSIWENHRKIILITFITTILSTAIAVAISIFLKLNISGYLASAGAVIMILEIIVIIRKIRKIEKAKIQLILKGGNVT